MGGLLGMRSDFPNGALCLQLPKALLVPRTGQLTLSSCLVRALSLGHEP